MVVLGGASPSYWRRRICDQPTALLLAGRSHPVVLEERCALAELPACLAVLQHIYTSQLPVGADAVLLSRVSGLQDMARCRTSCRSCAHALLYLSTCDLLLCLQMAEKAGHWDCTRTRSACCAQLLATAGAHSSHPWPS
jgi:hypothetical protein